MSLWKVTYLPQDYRISNRGLLLCSSLPASSWTGQRGLTVLTLLLTPPPLLRSVGSKSCFFFFFFNWNNPEWNCGWWGSHSVDYKVHILNFIHQLQANPTHHMLLLPITSIHQHWPTIWFVTFFFYWTSNIISVFLT